MPEQRLDAALASRGLARSRTHAATLIADGLVTVAGRGVIKASFKVADDQEIVVAGVDHYVSRAAHKLIAGLDAFVSVVVRDRVALDVGASTGGFTQVLLERGALHVTALDVGHGQIVPRLRGDERVSVVEGVNARNLTRLSLAEVSHDDRVPQLVVSDLSFISLPLVLPALVETADPSADFVLLVKPQFEVGRTGIREGIVRDPELRADAISGVLWSAWDLGLGTAGLVSSPILGTTGNHEYLVHLSRDGGTNPTEWRGRVAEVVHSN